MNRHEGTDEFLGRGACGHHGFPLRMFRGKPRPSIGVWCSLRAVTSNRNQVSRRYLVPTFHTVFFGRPSRPRNASVCPLDIGALIGVSLLTWSVSGRRSDVTLLAEGLPP